MSKMRQFVKREKLIRWHEYSFSRLNAVVDILILLFTIIGTFLGLREVDNVSYWSYLLVMVAALVISAKLYFLVKQFKDKRKYEYLRKTEELSVSTLQALKDANAAKTRYILQSTYGKIPEWHPTDYTKNILVYDVHEQIRSILLGLKNLIIDTTDGLSEDDVTVDLVYCYPEQNGYDGKLPVTQQEKTKEWRLITSGNQSLGGSVHAYLESKTSFFYLIDECGYAFYNDKMDCIKAGHYIVSEKDKESESNGSIIGLKIQLKNDEPETIFVKGILTITTYGRKLYEKGDFAKKDFERIFKQNVLNSHRSLLLSELAQMYIRHVIRDGDMCPKTGELKK